MERINSPRRNALRSLALVMSLPLLCHCAYDDGLDDGDTEVGSDGTYISTAPGTDSDLPAYDGDHIAERSPNCHARVPARAWRIRNATRARANAWALRGLRFCTNDDCSAYASGTVFDDGHSPTWGAPESLFDDDYSNFWKTRAGRHPGAAYVGLELSRATKVTAIALRPDNIVYGVSEIFVEYYDADVELWVTHAVLEDVPLHYGDIGSGGPTYPRDVWYIAPLPRCGPGSAQGAGASRGN